ncbi:MAG: maleylacetoacetate isomerase [Rhodobacter sp.]|uniref:maleylacetoacetate isomerase n=1 Tax=Pararhodobacter sp. TaxID=2127056 RepID=UPI001D8987EE|nr:maleylacetoacetate isomerase [Pararhodobacter sp.]MCB1344645.1 maleylacetoacetate isomerase [Paracoccaceae bacterium]MCC0071872.1 maleylacetoacetate isomerase [Rhodobacter sp.]HPD92599.1 maleylacetoacetate isomerase [Pararhodobacter sp.]
MRFHGYFRSSSSYRCRIAFNLKGLAYDFVPVHLVRDGGQQKSAAYRALNPQALVPTLEVDGQVLTQSPAILEWLDEAHPTPALLPQGLFERAAVRAFCAVIACEIHPLQNLRTLQYLEANYGQGLEGKEAWCQRWIGDGLAACEALLARRPATRFAFGDTPGMAEVYLVPQMFSAQRFKVDTSGLPRLRQIVAACEGLEAFERAHPARQPDAE